jgi:small subunit ribosomal protein S6e
MVNFKFVVADPKTRKSYKVEMDQDKVMGLVGKKIGDNFNGDLIGLSGYEIVITGGTDKDGFPMHPDVHGMVRKKIILASPPCFHPKKSGMRKRKMIVGDTISKNIVQVNCKIIKEGSKKLEDIFAKKEGEQTVKEEAPAEKKEEKPNKEEKK